VATPSITVATSGHLSTCPRLVKAATSFSEAGYRVRVVSALYFDHFRAMDKNLAANHAWTWDPIEWSRDRAWATWFWSGVRHRAAQRAAAVIGADRVPYAVARRAFTRLESELVDHLASEHADLYYGGGGEAIDAVAAAARRRGTRYGVDLEDFHTGERWHGGGVDARLAVIERVEREVLPGAVFLTAGSAPIADAYDRKYGVRPVPICNTFSLPLTPPLPPPPHDSLRTYWFSQTIGPGRGLEDAIRAMGVANVPMELHLRGAALDGYVESLRALGARVALRLRMEVHPVAPPDQMIALCHGYDVGLSVEPASSENSTLVLSNKILTFLPAGLAVVMTDTLGHQAVMADLGAAAVVCAPGDTERLAAGFRRWYEEPSALRAAMQASWQAACRRWHWEHAADRGALLAQVAAATAA
jgi:hypothetical protein